MKFCPNCGKELPENVKFCPYCGYKIAQDSDDIQESLVTEMSKGVTKSLDFSDTVDNYESSVQNEIPTPKRRHKKHKQVESDTLVNRVEEMDSVGQYLLPNGAIVVYFILNFILLIGNPRSDEIMGIFIYTWIVLAIIFFRKNKEKPFNWLLNIFLTLHGVLVFATAMMITNYLDAGADSIGAIILLVVLALMFLTILVMLYQGNRRRL